MFREVKSSAEESKMTAINLYSHAEVFAGRVVAFKTTSIYFGMKQGYTLGDSGIRYALVSESLVSCSGNPGYLMRILLNLKDTPSGNPLLDSRLKDANMQMRLATKDELILIKEAISSEQAEFEYEFNKEKMIRLLSNEIKKFEPIPAKRM